MPIKKLTVDRLSCAMRTTDDGVRSRAADLGEKVRAEHGVTRAVGIIKDGIA